MKGKEGKIQKEEKCRCLINSPTALYYGVHLLSLAMAECRSSRKQMGEKASSSLQAARSLVYALQR